MNRKFNLKLLKNYAAAAAGHQTGLHQGQFVCVWWHNRAQTTKKGSGQAWWLSFKMIFFLVRPICWGFGRVLHFIIEIIDVGFLKHVWTYWSTGSIGEGWTQKKNKLAGVIEWQVAWMVSGSSGVCTEKDHLNLLKRWREILFRLAFFVWESNTFCNCFVDVCLAKINIYQYEDSKQIKLLE